MAHKGRPLTDEAILAMLEHGVEESVSHQDSELSRLRAENQRYFDGEDPKPSARNNSRYRSLDVYDSVEAAKAAIMDVFSAEHGIARFKPRGPEDEQAALQETAYCDYVIFQQNDGEQVIEDVISDSLMGRNGIAKVFWEEVEEEFEEDHEDLDPAEFLMLIADDEVVGVLDDEEYVEELADGTEVTLIATTVLRKRMKGQVRICALPPEEFGISSKAKSLDDAVLKYHRWLESMSDLRKNWDLSDEDMEKIQRDDEEWEYDEEVLQRFEDIGNERDTIETLQESAQKTFVYEVYTQLDMEGTGETCLWKITYTGKFILDKEKVADHPFVSYACLPRAHSFWGNDFVGKIKPTQDAKTVLTRGILDHTVRTNNPRKGVVKGGVPNLKELTDDRFGGIVRMTRPDAIVDITQAPLNPFTFQTIQLLDTDLEDTTGVSRLSQGLSKEAVSNQNSADMIGQLTTLSQKRLKRMARHFQNQFVNRLYRLVSKLVRENEDDQRILNVTGNYVEVDPRTWDEREDFTLEPALGSEERSAEAEKWWTVDNLLVERGGPQYTPDRRYAVVSKALTNMGVRDVSRYYAHPSELPPPEPDPMMLKEMEFKERELITRERAQMLGEARLQFEQAKFQAQHELDQLREQVELLLKERDQNLAERKQAHDEQTRDAELQVLQSADDVRGIASPNA
ncbi:MAG: hypothetical protein AAF608_05035 [Pseudomonadota bacterium]